MILRAKYVMPSSHEVFEDGALRLNESEIIEVGPFSMIARGQTDRVVDLGETAVLPGFINAHTHLELGRLAGKLPPPASIVNWLAEVRRLRETEPAAIAQTVSAGAQAALEGGTTTLADVTFTGLSVDPLRTSPIRKLVHFETLGFDEPRTTAALADLHAKLAGAETDDLLTVGLSPHAPYSTSATLYRECVRIARERGLPLCSHVAESLDEEAFLQRGTGPFRELLESLGIGLEEWTPPGKTPVQYLHDLGFFESSPLLIHGNYIRMDDIPILRDLNVTVVFCPRSHAYFGHEEHPFERLFALGVNVALGTDSLASAPNLSMLDEMRFLHARYPRISPERILTLAMLNGAKTLRVRARIGGLRAGWKADLVAVALPAMRGRVAERILADESRVVFTMVNGHPCYDAR